MTVNEMLPSIIGSKTRTALEPPIVTESGVSDTPSATTVKAAGLGAAPDSASLKTRVN